LQALKVRLARKGVRHSKRDLKPAPRAVEHGVLLRRKQRITGPHCLDGLCQLHLPRAPSAGGRDGGNEAAPGTGKGGSVLAVIAFEDHELGNEALRGGLMFGDVVFVDRRQSGIEAHRESLCKIRECGPRPFGLKPR